MIQQKYEVRVSWKTSREKLSNRNHKETTCHDCKTSNQSGVLIQIVMTNERSCIRTGIVYISLGALQKWFNWTEDFIDLSLRTISLPVLLNFPFIRFIYSLYLIHHGKFWITFIYLFARYVPTYFMYSDPYLHKSLRPADLA